MRRRPPKSTRTYTRFPYTTLFRSLCRRADIQRIAGVEHHGDLVSLFPGRLGASGKSLRMRAVREAAGMQGDHAGMDVVAAEEFAAVIEDHLVVIVVVVEERHFQGLRRSEEHTSELQSIMRISYA